MRKFPRCRFTVVSGGCLVAFLLAGICSAGQPKSQAEPVSITHLSLSVGGSLLIDSLLPITRVSVGFGDIAEAAATGPRELLLNGKTPGVTSLIVWYEGGTRRLFDVTVAPSHFLADNRMEVIKGQIVRELPGQSVNLSFENDTVFLRGTVKDVTSADRAVSIASTLGKTVNLLYVDVPPPALQILLKVKFASVDRSLNTQLGVNIVSTGAGNTVGTLSTGQFSPPTVTSGGTSSTVTVADALNLFLYRRDLNLGATIKALETKGLLQILAEPNMLAENGKQASFLAGGEFPFPSVNSASGGTPSVSIQFREFGVRLTFIPTITPRGTIHLQVAPEVSALDFTNGLSVSGFNVPALTTRKLNTQVELSEGESFAIGGLLDNRTTDTLEKIPFIGDIPILGKLFQSKTISRQNTELIVIVTPVFVQPIPAGRTAPGLNYPRPFLPENTQVEEPISTHRAGGPASVDHPLPPIPIETIQNPQPAADQVAPPGAGPKVPK
ncbi:MAG: pilus assembly protein N-terminal domain-containing protein [Acidobacteriota bacterium]|nr:pilus assembly protein N-terminal domain-containing protein [Acidobacteriota bacterium]